ncbi:MAG: hypothetical protein IIZ97_05330 [Prevotella sp.]|nr:hypothetical protein [Prevotella sp.]
MSGIDLFLSLRPSVRKNSASRSKGEKTGEKVARFAEKQYLCGRKAVIAFTHGPQRRLPEQELCIL